jgi:phosphoserine phosphatase RsbU/P
MATTTESYLHSQLAERRKRLAVAIAAGTPDGAVAGLLSEVDAALERVRDGSFGICEECHDPVEQERLLADPLVRFCIDHLNERQRRRLEQDLELASTVQRALLPPHDIRADGWQTHYSYEPTGVVSGDYCDVIPGDGAGEGASDVFLSLGDVSGQRRGSVADDDAAACDVSQPGERWIAFKRVACTR